MRFGFNLSLFATKDETNYLKVSTKEDVLVGKILTDGQTVCYLEDKPDYSIYWPVKNGKVEIGKVYGDEKDFVRVIKLRVQDQLGIPASYVTITRRQQQYYSGDHVDVPVGDNKRMDSEYTINVKIC